MTNTNSASPMPAESERGQHSKLMKSKTDSNSGRAGVGWMRLFARILGCFLLILSGNTLANGLETAAGTVLFVVTCIGCGYHLIRISFANAKVRHSLPKQNYEYTKN